MTQYYCTKITEKTFNQKTTKKSYMEAVKWYASNVISKGLNGVQVEFRKHKNDCGVTAIVYVSLPEKEVSEEHCNCCREMHHAFFINEANDCSRCNMLAYKKRMEKKSSIKSSFVKEKIGLK